MHTRIQVPIRYAGLAPRCAALVLDFAALSLVFFPITKIVKGVWIMTAGNHRWSYGWMITDPLCLAYLVIIVLYFVLLEGLSGATVGKRLLGIRVIRREGGLPGLRAAALRNILRAVDALPIFNILGVVLIVASPEKARFGDRVARTRVVLRP